MPYPNEHACRLRDPGDFQAGSFRRVQRVSNGRRYSVIMGRLKGQTKMTEQAYRYPKTIWTVAQARKHCRDHNGQTFEPAAGAREYNNISGGNMPTKTFHGKVIDIEKVAKGEPGDPIRFRLTERMVDRDSEVLEPKGAQLKNFKKNPVVLWSHNRGFDVPKPAIGKIDPKSFDQTQDYLDGDIIFDVENDPFARMIDAKIRNGFLNTGSVGFKPLVISREPVLPGQKGVTYLKWDLMEFSIVNIPANPGASRREWEEFIEACKNFGDEYAPDPQTFFTKYGDFFNELSTEKFEPIPEEVTESWVNREMSRLLAARGCPNVTESEKQKRYNELAELLEVFGREAPEYKTYDYEFIDHHDGTYEIRNYEPDKHDNSTYTSLFTENELILLSDNIGKALCSLSDVKMLIENAMKGKRINSTGLNEEILDGILSDLTKLRKIIRNDNQPVNVIEALYRQIREI